MAEAREMAEMPPSRWVTLPKAEEIFGWSRAQIHNGGKFRHLGYFERKEDAAEAYNRAAESAYGHYARLNEVA